MGWYVLTKLTRPITGLLERDLRRMEEKGKVWEVDKRWIGLCMYKGWRWGKQSMYSKLCWLIDSEMYLQDYGTVANISTIVYTHSMEKKKK